MNARHRWQRELAPRGGVGRVIRRQRCPTTPRWRRARCWALGGRDDTADADDAVEDDEGEGDADDGGSDETQLHDPPSDFDDVPLDDIDVDVEPVAAAARAEPDWPDDHRRRGGGACILGAGAGAGGGRRLPRAGTVEGLELIRGPNTTGFKACRSISRSPRAPMSPAVLRPPARLYRVLCDGGGGGADGGAPPGDAPSAVVAGIGRLTKVKSSRTLDRLAR